MATAPSPALGRLVFRVAAGSDVDALVALIESAYRGESSKVGWTTEADILHGQRTDPQGVLEVIEKSDSRMIAVRCDGLLVACYQLERRGDSAYFGMFAVRPTAQGAGIGKAILAAAERTAREEWGAHAMEMKVISMRQDLIAWYERRGYRRTGTMIPFPYGDERFGVPLRADLEFELLVKPLV